MYRINKLDIYIVKQFMLLFAGTFCISLFVLMMQFVWRYVDELIGKGLSIDILAQFFWHLSLTLVPLALPLAILLASLITMGNIGENSELTAIKAAGISLMQTLRPLIIICCFITVGSFYFQNNIGPKSTKNLTQLLISIKQKSPELEIPEGIFYDRIPQCNLYVQKKDLNTGMLYGVMIYRMNNSFNDAAIILADSGKMQSTADKQHLLLTLYSGEWFERFENMHPQQFGGNANVPYRRESFISKKILLEFNSGMNMADMADLSNKAEAKSLQQISHTVDSLNKDCDSIGKATRKILEWQLSDMSFPRNISKNDSITAVKQGQQSTYSFDTVVSKLKPTNKLRALQRTLNNILLRYEGRSSNKWYEFSHGFDSVIESDIRRSIMGTYHDSERMQAWNITKDSILIFSLSSLPDQPSYGYAYTIHWGETDSPDGFLTLSDGRNLCYKFTADGLDIYHGISHIEHEDFEWFSKGDLLCHLNKTNLDNAVPGRWPEASIFLLTRGYLEPYPTDVLRLMRNEIYARHGHSFIDKQLTEFYSKEGLWYGTALLQQNSTELSEIEKLNVQLIIAIEKERNINQAKH